MSHETPLPGEPPLEIQASFARFIAEGRHSSFHGSETLKVVPERLLRVACDDPLYVYRNYYSADLRSPKNFFMAASATISKHKVRFMEQEKTIRIEVRTAFGIAIFGENQDQYLNLVQQDNNMYVWIRENGRMLQLPYFRGEKRFYELYASEFTDGASKRYKHKQLQDGDTMIFEITVRGQTYRYRVPMGFDFDPVGLLFHSRTVADPINSDPNLDKSWSNPELFRKTLGIRSMS